MKLKASNERYPPLSSESDCFHLPPKATFSSRPSSIDFSGILAILAVAPYSRELNIYPKCWLTSWKHFSKVSIFLSSRSTIFWVSMDLSYKRIFRFSSSWENSFSTYSVIDSTLKLTYLESLFWSNSSRWSLSEVPSKSKSWM